MGRWDDLVGHWRRDLASRDPRAVERSSGAVAVLPGREPVRRRPGLLLVVLLALAEAVLLLLVHPWLGLTAVGLGG